MSDSDDEIICVSGTPIKGKWPTEQEIDEITERMVTDHVERGLNPHGLPLEDVLKRFNNFGYTGNFLNSPEYIRLICRKLRKHQSNAERTLYTEATNTVAPGIPKWKTQICLEQFPTKPQDLQIILKDFVLTLSGKSETTLDEQFKVFSTHIWSKEIEVPKRIRKESLKAELDKNTLKISADLDEESIEIKVTIVDWEILLLTQKWIYSFTFFDDIVFVLIVLLFASY